MVTLSDKTPLQEKENNGNNIIDSNPPPPNNVDNESPTATASSISCSDSGVGGLDTSSSISSTNHIDGENSTSSPRVKRDVSSAQDDDGGLTDFHDHDSPKKRPRTDDKNENANAVVAAIAAHGTTKKVSSTGALASTTTDREKEDMEGDETAPSQSKPLDLAETLGLKAGDRLEVQWEIHDEEGNDIDHNNNNNNDQDGESPTTTTRTIWWKATLLEHDGRTTDSVAIRVLDYDPQPGMGFPDRSQEDVIFLGHDLVVSPDDDSIQLTFRREGETELDQVFWYTEENLDEQLNSILMGALQKNEVAWCALPASAQAAIAEKIQKKKEELKERLRSQNKIITPETIKEILAQAF